MRLFYSMSDFGSDTLEMNQEQIFTHAPGETLALADLETYPAFVAKKADRLDMMAHFANQMQALTVLSWKAPETAKRFRLMLTENDFLVERIGRSNPAQIASGNLRTYGQVLFATHEHLFDCARHRDRDLLKSSPRSKKERTKLLNIPPGVYAIAMYYDARFHEKMDSPAATPRREIDYTIIMRHYAFPPPRVAPVRLSAGFIPWAGEEAAAQAWAGRTSHKSPA
jgi:hypothetical protein